jgi:hypothetical protein
VTGIAALRSKWAAGKAVRAGLALEGAYLNRYVTEEQRSRRPIFIATLRAARLSAGPAAAGSLIGRRPQRVFSLFASRIQPKYAAAPLYQSRTWCTSSADLRLRLERRRGRESRHPLPRDRIPCVQLLRVESSNIVSEAGVRGF